MDLRELKALEIAARVPLAWQERLCPLTEDWRVRNKATA